MIFPGYEQAFQAHQPSPRHNPVQIGQSVLFFSKSGNVNIMSDMIKKSGTLFNPIHKKN